MHFMVMNFIYLFTYEYLATSICRLVNAGISDGRGEDNHTFRRVTNGRKSMCFYMVANELFIYLD